MFFLAFLLQTRVRFIARVELAMACMVSTLWCEASGLAAKRVAGAPSMDGLDL